MSEAVEKKLPVKNLERIGETVRFYSYEEADRRRQAIKGTPGLAKLKIFARYDGTFDLVCYQKIQPKKVEPAKPQEPVVETKSVHGQKSKDRKKSLKKTRE